MIRMAYVLLFPIPYNDPMPNERTPDQIFSEMKTVARAFEEDADDMGWEELSYVVNLIDELDRVMRGDGRTFYVFYAP